MINVLVRFESLDGLSTTEFFENFSPSPVLCRALLNPVTRCWIPESDNVKAIHCQSRRYELVGRSIIEEKYQYLYREIP